MDGFFSEAGGAWYRLNMRTIECLKQKGWSLFLAAFLSDSIEQEQQECQERLKGKHQRNVFNIYRLGGFPYRKRQSPFWNGVSPMKFRLPKCDCPFHHGSGRSKKTVVQDYPNISVFFRYLNGKYVHLSKNADQKVVDKWINSLYIGETLRI